MPRQIDSTMVCSFSQSILPIAFLISGQLIRLPKQTRALKAAPAFEHWARLLTHTVEPGRTLALAASGMSNVCLGPVWGHCPVLSRRPVSYGCLHCCHWTLPTLLTADTSQWNWANLLLKIHTPLLFSGQRRCLFTVKLALVSKLWPPRRVNIVTCRSSIMLMICSVWNFTLYDAILLLHALIRHSFFFLQLSNFLAD